MEKSRVFAVTLARAAEIVGGTRALRDVLGVRQMHLDAWLNGRSSPPAAVFLTAVDLIESAKVGNDESSQPNDRQMLKLLEAAIARTGADFGNVQLRQGNTLHIVAQQGFDAPFLQYFARVEGPDCVCGAAMVNHARFCVEDAAAHPMFADTAAGTVLGAAGVRAVESTPIIGREGDLLGVLSTHFKSPHVFGSAELAMLDEIAAAAGAALSAARSAS